MYVYICIYIYIYIYIRLRRSALCAQCCAGRRADEWPGCRYSLRSAKAVALRLPIMTATDFPTKILPLRTSEILPPRFSLGGSPSVG